MKSVSVNVCWHNSFHLSTKKQKTKMQSLASLNAEWEITTDELFMFISNFQAIPEMNSTKIRILIWTTNLTFLLVVLYNIRAQCLFIWFYIHSLMEKHLQEVIFKLGWPKSPVKNAFDISHHIHTRIFKKNTPQNFTRQYIHLLWTMHSDIFYSTQFHLKIITGNSIALTTHQWIANSNLVSTLKEFLCIYIGQSININILSFTWHICLFYLLISFLKIDHFDRYILISICGFYFPNG